jgi:hypothetical protein
MGEDRNWSKRKRHVPKIIFQANLKQTKANLSKPIISSNKNISNVLKNATIVKPFNFSNTEDNLMKNYDLQKYWQEDLDVEENGYTSNKVLASDKRYDHTEGEKIATEALISDQQKQQLTNTAELHDINIQSLSVDNNNKSDIEANIDTDKENNVNASGVTDIEESEYEEKGNLFKEN